MSSRHACPGVAFLKVLNALMPPSNFEGNIFYIYSHLYAWGKPNSRGGNSQQAEAKSKVPISTYSILGLLNGTVKPIIGPYTLMP